MDLIILTLFFCQCVAGREIYDGAGSMSGVYTQGNEDVVYTGSYTIANEVTCRTVLQSTYWIATLYVSPGSSFIPWIAMTPGVASAGYLYGA